MAQLTIKLSDGSHNTEQTLARKNPGILSFKGDDVSCVWQNQTLTITNNVSGAEIFRLELADVQHIVFQGDLKQIPHKDVSKAAKVAAGGRKRAAEGAAAPKKPRAPKAVTAPVEAPTAPLGDGTEEIAAEPLKKKARKSKKASEEEVTAKNKLSPEVLAAFAAVDYVVVFDAPDPARVIRAVQPDVLVKGGDWPISQIVGADFVQSRGGRVLSLPYVEGASTSALIGRILGKAVKRR